MFKETSYEAFARPFQAGQIAPVCREICADWLTPVSAFMRLSSGHSSTFLAENFGGRYSFIGRDPFMTLHIRGARIQLEKENETFVLSDQPLETIRKVLSKYRRATDDRLPPFTAGMFGYIGYDAYRWLDNVADPYLDDSALDDAVLMLFRTLFVLDHSTQRLLLIYNAFPDQAPKLPVGETYEKALDRLDEMEENLLYAIRTMPVAAESEPPSPEIQSYYAAADFAKAVDDLRQLETDKTAGAEPASPAWVNFCLRHKVGVDLSPFNLYRAWRLAKPGKYHWYMHYKQRHLMGASDVTALQIENERICLLDNKRSPTSDRAGLYSTQSLQSEKDALAYLFEDYPPQCGQPREQVLETIDGLENHRRAATGGVAGYLDFCGNCFMAAATQTALYYRKKWIVDQLAPVSEATLEAQSDQALQEIRNVIVSAGQILS